MSESTETVNVEEKKPEVIQEETKVEQPPQQVFPEEKITEDGGIIKQILVQGTGKDFPNDDQVVEVSYVAKFEGKEIETRNKDYTFTIKIGNPDETDLKFWNIVAKQMKQGEKALYTIQPQYAYGDKGLENKVPANATVQFEVETIEIKEKSKWQYSKDVKNKKAYQSKDEGNKLFKQNKFNDAIKQYKEALDWIDYGNEYDEFRIQCWGNQAAANLKLKLYSEALDNIKEILEKDPKNSKALYRKGQAKFGQCFYDEAKQAFNQVLEIEPNNQAVKEELYAIEKKVKLDQQKDKKVYKNIFSHHFYEDTEVLYHHADNPIVYLDIQIGNKEVQRLEIELFKHIVPKTANNFLGLCTGDKKYKDNIFHRNIKDFMIQGGDYENKNGTGGKSIYGSKFEDENFKAKHLERGFLSMANSGPNTNGSQFFITYKDTPHLDGKHVVFGKVVKNQNFLNDLEKVESESNDVPKETIKIVDCGEVAKKPEPSKQGNEGHKCDSCSSSDEDTKKNK